MAAEINNIIRYMITGEDGEVIPRDATHVSVHPTVRIIPRRLFYYHPNIIELICHECVIKIEEYAFAFCPRLKRVIMKGVEVLEWGAFKYCEALEHIECDKLEIIGEFTFYECDSITYINLTSAKILRDSAFRECPALVSVEFGRNLESIEGGVFYNCYDLERITFPLKNGLNIKYDTFHHENLKHVE